MKKLLLVILVGCCGCSTDVFDLFPIDRPEPVGEEDTAPIVVPVDEPVITAPELPYEVEDEHAPEDGPYAFPFGDKWMVVGRPGWTHHVECWVDGVRAADAGKRDDRPAWISKTGGRVVFRYGALEEVMEP